MQLYKEQFARGRVRKIQEYTIRNCIQRLCDAHSKPHREKQIADARDRFVAKGHDPHTWEPNKVNTTRAPDEEAFTERLRAEADQDPVAFLAKYAHPHD
jgi:hypothetical protein